MESASVSSPVMTPPAPRLKPPSGPGSYGARLLTTIGETSGSVRVTYARTDDAGVVLRIEVMRGRSVSAMLMGFPPHGGIDTGGRHRLAAAPGPSKKIKAWKTGPTPSGGRPQRGRERSGRSGAPSVRYRWAPPGRLSAPA